MIRMSPGIAYVLGCKRIEFDMGGYPIDPPVRSWLVSTGYGGFWYWPIVPDELP